MVVGGHDCPGGTVIALALLAAGLGLAMALLPATRFGYPVYPLVLGAPYAHLGQGEGPRVTRTLTATNDCPPRQGGIETFARADRSALMLQLQIVIRCRETLPS